jgi:hypothetical protein
VVRIVVSCARLLAFRALTIAIRSIVWSNKRFYPKQIVYSFFDREHCFYHYIAVMFKIFLKNVVQNMFRSRFNFFFVLLPM